jgi:bifunctional UDP-N-acetylglucosamine pyrophosphorylase/glucosamine-1-phosphate N-acetyltransferase/UDP-N-acetylglucosamine pyrophosphorylase
MDNIKAVILAAGKGKRLQSEEEQTPKAMREVAGKPILHYVLNSIDFIKKENIIIVVKYLKEMITDAFPEYTFVVQQDEQFGYGTGFAVKCTEQAIGAFSGNILVLMGDMPLVTRQTLLNLCSEHIANNNDCTNLSCETNEPLPTGRIIRDNAGNFREIIENKDCTDEQRKITEYNTGNAIFNSQKLFEQLKNLKNNNKSGEYYLTDIPKLFFENNYRVGVCKSENETEIHGANSIEELNLIETILKSNSAK